MINIIEKVNCCGCSACVQACPKQCICFDEDEQGFRYPLVNKDLCVDCGLCENVCPCLNQNEKKEPLKVVAAKNPNEDVRLKSSSGGFFSMIAEKIIDEGGVVFGARFDENWEVMHDYTETLDGIEAFRGSKYLQSRIGETYRQTRVFLNDGRKVLFSGTGCQIAGLKKFLRKDYDNLLTIEILCHSVPSPLVWRKYMNEKCNGNQIESINFRDKRSGWSNYSYSIVVKHNGGEYIESASGHYMRGLTSNLTTRPSCSQCPARFGKSGADIVLGDCWGIWNLKPEMDDNKGVSIVETFSKKGQHFISDLNYEYTELQLEDLAKYNSGLSTLKPIHKEHNRFFMEIGSNIPVSKSFDKYLQISNKSLFPKLKRVILSILKRIK